MFLGIDIGSSSSKVVILDAQLQQLAGEVVNLGTGTRGAREALALAYAAAGCGPEDILYRVVTGYGRMTFTEADTQITEISCHAKGARHLEPALGTLVDVGGQDCKVIALDKDGAVSNFVMNDKCAAGTGRFLEVMARVLDCPIAHLSALAQQSTEPLPISSMCTVFAESEVISHLAGGAATADVAAGAISSIVTRLAGLCGRVGLRPKLMFSGGGALNAALVEALSVQLGQPIAVSPQPQLMGALGAAVFAAERYQSKK